MGKAKIENFRAALAAYSDSTYRYSLPAGLYTSKSWLAYEIKHLLRHEWICLGRVAEVPDTGDAPPLAPRLTGLDAILKNFHTDEMHHVFVTEEIWDANWKCLLENFMEGYHLSRVHPQTLGGRTPTRLCEKFESGEGYTGYRANYPHTAPFRGNCHPDLTEKEKSCSTLFSIYPAMVASQSSDVLAYMSLQPAGVDQVRIRWGLSVYDKDMPAAEIQSRVELWQAINAEDQIKLAKVQHALHSKSAVSGPLAPDDFEGTIRDIYGYLAKRLQHHAPATDTTGAL